MKKIILKYAVLITGFFIIPFMVFGGQNSVVINEIAWMGTQANSSDEWVELFNTTDNEIDLSDWKLYEAGGQTLIIALKNKISPNGYYLIERSDDNSISDINADVFGSFGGSGLNNSGEYLVLKDNNGDTVDEVNFSSKWPAGSASPNYKSMERINAAISGSDADNWKTFSGTPFAFDANYNPIMGTPKQNNNEQTSKDVSSPQPLSPSPEPSNSAPTPSPSVNAQIHPEIIITEFLPNPAGEDKNNEWIELYNNEDEDVSLQDYWITNSSEKKYVLNALSITSKSYLIINSTESGIIIKNTGDELNLFYPNNSLAFRIKFDGGVKEGLSFSRFNGQWAWTTPTPGKENIKNTPTPASKTTGQATKTNEQKSEFIGQDLDTRKSGNDLGLILIILSIAAVLGIIGAILVIVIKKI